MFSVTLNAVQIVSRTDGENIELASVVALTPQGPHGEVAVIPAGNVFLPIPGKENALRLGKEITEQAEALPEPKRESDLVVPDNAAAVAKAAKEGNLGQPTNVA